MDVAETMARAIEGRTRTLWANTARARRFAQGDGACCTAEEQQIS